MGGECGKPPHPTSHPIAISESRGEWERKKDKN